MIRPPLRRAAVGAVSVALCAALAPAVPAAAAAKPPAPPSDKALAAEPARHDLTREQFYFVLPDRFANGDTANDRGGLTGSRLETGFDPTDKGFYQGGDLKGLTQKLDYIKGLGTTSIWMAPIFKNKPVQGTGKDASAGYHGYWITDFTQVDPHFGTNADLEKLIDKAHAKGMKVFFDVITNHTADTVDYAEKKYGYRSKGAYPYLDRNGRPFDDREGVGKTGRDSFPYTPKQSGDGERKVPAWLNDPTMYHNRGDSTFAGESSEYGDFSGLDDLWTERPEVVDGMAEIYRKWVRDFDIDGFRIDTVKHVDLDFWTQWATALDAYAKKQGRDDFFMFGEVYSADTTVTSSYVTRGRLDSTLDFPLQDATRAYASQGAAAGRLAKVFAEDYRYTTDKANAYEQVSFTGNHDMGRLGTFLRQDNPKAGDAELLGRARLANELMFLSRGNPVVYYGDEQGFTGAGGDKDARQTLFASKTADYLDDDQLGTDRTHASDAYDTTHPLYRSIAALSKLTKDHPALRDGVQQELHAQGPVYAFSRTDAKRGAEYVVAANNSAGPRTVELTTGSAHTDFRALYGTSETVRSDAGRKVKVTVPALSSVVLRAAEPLPAPAARPALTLRAPAAGATGTDEIGCGRRRRAAQPCRLRRPDGQRQVAHARLRRPRPVQGHPVPGRRREGRNHPALQGRCGGQCRTHRERLASTTAGRTPAPDRPAAVERDHAVVHYKRPDGDYDGWQLKSGDKAAAFTGRRRVRRLRMDQTRRGSLVAPVHRREGRHGGRPPAHRRPRQDRRGLDRAGRGRPGRQGPRRRVPAPGQGEGRTPLPARRRGLRRLGPAHLDRRQGAHRLVQAADAGEEGRVRRDLRGPARLRRHVPQLHPPQGGREGPPHRPVPRPGHPRPRGVDAGRAAHVPAAAGRRGASLDLAEAEAQWIDKDTVVWKVKATDATSQQLVYARDGGISVVDGALSDEGRWLRLSPSALTVRAEGEVPAPQGPPRLHRRPARPRPRPRGPARPGRRHPAGRQRRPVAATGVQLPGVLDDTYTPPPPRRPSAPSSARAAPSSPSGPPPPSTSPSNSTAGPSRCGATTAAASGPSPAPRPGRASRTGTS